MPESNPEPQTQEELKEKLKNGESLAELRIGDVDFTNRSFDKIPDFSGEVFTGLARFRRTKFLNGADFTESKFLEKKELISGEQFFQVKGKRTLMTQNSQVRD